MRAGYRVLRGADPLAAARGRAAPICGRRWSASSGASCSACARATRLRPETRSARRRWPPAAPATILVLLRALLTLAGRPVPGGARGARGRGGRRWSGVPAGRWPTPVEHRGERGWRCTAMEFEDYLDAVARAAGFVDQLQLGDQ